MSRWAPDAALRLERAALELFVEQGYTATSVPEIAARAGLTTRTFFRHFSDKREVLFLRERELPAVAAALVAGAPAFLSPLGLVMHGFEAMAAGPFEGWREDLQARRAVVGSDPGLRERELLKNVLLADVLTAALLRHGVDRGEARLVARYAVMVFELALTDWLDTDGAALVDVLHSTAYRMGRLVRPPRQDE
ncbi:helix-turn-helix domain-containing protein [Arthrobacter sp. NPDC092385]|uniref:TetR/AcrR family transcriptional regulator n=1 Tax=Arthrobacter sp. NPDC092385 TaxID=3363943 RepID=UPI00381B5096